MESWFIAGVDLGQRQDYTALAVMERQRLTYMARDPATYALHQETRFRLRHVERVALGTPYPQVVEQVATLVGSGELLGKCELVADATGVGLPVVQMIKQRCRGTRVVAVSITGGLRESSDGTMWHVPKRNLMMGLRVAFDGREFGIVKDLPLAQTVRKELLSMEVKASPGGGEQFGAWREGEHDDLVLAIALAWWRAGRKEQPCFGSCRLVGT